MLGQGRSGQRVNARAVGSLRGYVSQHHRPPPQPRTADRLPHHPADILGSLLFSARWLTAVSMLIRPGADDRSRGRPGVPGGRDALAGRLSR
jgi:hypothetical protein